MTLVTLQYTCTTRTWHITEQTNITDCVTVYVSGLANQFLFIANQYPNRLAVTALNR